jgi:hypothetical protein
MISGVTDRKQEGRFRFPRPLVPTLAPVSGTTSHIGTLRETPLHADLKRWYALSDDEIEVPVDGYVVDLVRADLLIEIQTSGFSSMKKKLANLLMRGHRVRIVHPIAAEKRIVKVDDDGTIVDSRRSPKRGAVVDVFSELVSFPDLVVDGDLEIEVVLTREDEYRRHTPGRSWRRKGWSVMERRLVEIVDTRLITDRRALASLLPDALPETFTTADLAMRLDRPRRLAQQMAYCLRESRVIASVGKQGNAMEYAIVDEIR